MFLVAKGDVEIEIKIPVSKVSFGKVRRYLKKNAVLMGKSRDTDKYYNLPIRSFLKTKHPIEYLRIRAGSGGSFINYKYNYLNSKGKKTHADEYESRVENAIQLEKILSALSYKNFMTVDKHRESYQTRSGFEVDLDEVSGLGYFVEVEAKKDFGNRGKTYEEVVKLVKMLGLNPDDQDQNGYVLLLMKKKGLVG